MKTLITLGRKASLGEHAQMMILSQHLKKYKPDWEIDFEGGTGNTSCLRTWFKTIYHQPQTVPNHAQYDKIIPIKKVKQISDLAEYALKYSVPPTMTTEWLREMELIPIEGLYRYNLKVSQRIKLKVAQKLKRMPTRRGRVCIQFKKDSSMYDNTLSMQCFTSICNVLNKSNYTPIHLAWDESFPKPHNNRYSVWGHEYEGDAETILALLQSSVLIITVGPGITHLAASTSVPTIAIWDKSHPIHEIDFCDNVTHIMKNNLKSNILTSHRSKLFTYFNTRYKHREYKDLEHALINNYLPSFLDLV